MRKIISLILVAALALCAVGAMAEYDKDTVKAVQQALNDAGFSCGTPDGAAGKKTKAAIADYQSANGLEATGAIDDALLIALGLLEADAPAGEEVPELAEEDVPELPEGVSVWIADEQNYVLFDDNEGTLTARIDWIADPVIYAYTVQDGAYIIEGNAAEVNASGDEMEVFYYERGTVRQYHRGTAAEYARILAQHAANRDVSWLMGEWKLRTLSAEDAGTITINEDHTCVMNGEAFTWREGVDGAYDKYGITLDRDGAVVYSIVGTADSEYVMLMKNSVGMLSGDIQLIR